MSENLEQLKEDMTMEYSRLMSAREQLYGAGEKVIETRRDLDKMKGEAIIMGALDGKNEAEREARAREKFYGMYTILWAAEADERLKKVQFERTLTYVELLRLRLRLAELAERMTTADRAE